MVWGILVTHLSVYWNNDPQYSYGWLVPLLCAYMIAERRSQRPPASSAHLPKVALTILTLAALALLPTWILEQPNPDWRLISWALASETVLITGSILYLTGGRNRLLHFAFPLLFFLTAVPWPFGVEWLVIQKLTGFVVAVTVEIANLFGIAALQHGNVIEVNNGFLGVDEACSGIRSLQASFMASLFIGDLYKFRVSRRISLIAAGAVLALLCNCARAMLLVLVAVNKGADAISQWHDRAGFTILTGCMLGLWLVANWMRGREVQPSKIMPKDTGSPSRLHPALLWSLGAWLVMVLAATELWYRSHEHRTFQTWTFTWPAERASFSEQPFSTEAAGLLKFDEGRAAQWHERDGSSRAAFFLQWKPRPSRSQSLARTHRPEICLAASGYKLGSSFGTVDLTVNGLTIPFEHYLFEKDGRPVHIFFCVWQPHANEATRLASRYSWNRSAGLEFALLGVRNSAQQVLEYAIFDVGAGSNAVDTFTREMPRLIKSIPD